MPAISVTSSSAPPKVRDHLSGFILALLDADKSRTSYLPGPRHRREWLRRYVDRAHAARARVLCQSDGSLRAEGRISQEVLREVRGQVRVSYRRGHYAGMGAHLDDVAIMHYADHDQENAFDEAVVGVDAILHMASPVSFGVEDPQGKYFASYMELAS